MPPRRELMAVFRPHTLRPVCSNTPTKPCAVRGECPRDRPMPSSASSILPRIRVVDYGVLGTQLAAGTGIVKRAEPPDDFTAFVDPAGLTFIQRVGPGGAGGASASIYEHIGIQDDDDFPDDVREAITEECDAHYHRCACLLYTSPSPRDRQKSRMPSSA